MSIIELLSLDFVQRALLAALLVSLTCGAIGALVVVNRLTFLAGGIAHTAYGGVGLAFFLALPVLPTALLFTLFAALLMGWVTRHQQQRADTVIGAMWAGGMALGIILLDKTPGYQVDIMSYLFGSILTVSANDLYMMGGMLFLILLLVVRHYQDFVALAFEADFARTRGVPVGRLHYLLLALVAISVVMVIQAVGLILVIALLTIPVWLGEQRSQSLWGMMWRACCWCLVFCLCGLSVAYYFDIASGAAIIATASVVFFVLQIKR